jgi:hypothetical protein
VAGIPGKIAPVKRDRTGRRRPKACECVQRQRLADAVSPEHGDEVTALRVERECVHERASGDRDVDAAALQPKLVIRCQGCSRSCCQGSA